nr:MAG TPA: hypothetical protein [Caudoviricetes sp.]
MPRSTRGAARAVEDGSNLQLLLLLLLLKTCCFDLLIVENYGRQRRGARPWRGGARLAGKDAGT